MFKLFKKEPYWATHRVGLVEMVVTGWGRYAGIETNAQVKVEELDTAGDYSRVQVLNITGISKEFARQIWNKVPEYIPTDVIDWIWEPEKKV